MRLPRSRTLTPDEIRRLTRRLLFGLLGVVLIVGATLGGLTAYAGMWPPALVVESGSMRHSDAASEIGVLDTGDVALIQAVHGPGDVVTYLAGRATGYTSFGDFGDVIAFADPEPNETAVLVHRAFALVIRNGSGGFDVPELATLPRSDWWGTAIDGTNATGAVRLRAFTVAKVGWTHGLSVTWDVASLGANYSNDGFLTFGDRNLYRTSNRTDPWILPTAYVLARIRGELPWIGLLRLTLIRSPEGCCVGWGSTDPDVGAPGNSWFALEILLVLIIAGPVAADVAWKRLPRPIWRIFRFLRRERERVETTCPDENPEDKDNPEEETGVAGRTAEPGAGDANFGARLETIDVRVESDPTHIVRKDR